MSRAERNTEQHIDTKTRQNRIPLDPIRGDLLKEGSADLKVASELELQTVVVELAAELMGSAVVGVEAVAVMKGDHC